ncbi:MAG: sensor domain-containing diguanylate cyclase [Deltaproteobacteria bacterium]|nr:sensor domain-containing diguanylate cyclase [Deltaproteobacteria bacterium]
MVIRGSHSIRLQLAARVLLFIGAVSISASVLGHLLLTDLGGPTLPGVFADVIVNQWIAVGSLILALSMVAVAWPWLREQSSVKGEARTQARQSASAVAMLAAMDRERTDATRHLRALVEELTLLYEVGQEINSTIELDTLFEVITKMAHRHLQLNEFAILLMEDNGCNLRVHAAHGFPNLERIRDMVFNVGEGVSGEVARIGQLVYVPDTRRDPRYLHYRGEHREDGAFLAIPLRYKNDILGVINFSRRGVGSFSKNDIRLLTLMANQIAFLQVEWKRAVRFRRPLSVLMVDVDRFKVFNDTFGHLQGDLVLKQLSDLLRRNLREVDTVARFGGEEFVVLLPDTDKMGASAAADKLRHFVEQERFPLPTDVAGAATPLTISIGVSVYPDDAAEMEDLIDHADIALYEAKDAGRNRMVCYPSVTLVDTVTPITVHAPRRFDS